MNIFFKKKPKLPTDLEILQCIYDEYYRTFVSYSPSSRNNKIYVPIDFDKIGEKLGVDGDIPFGRIHYFLNFKYRFKADDGTIVDLFVLKIGQPNNQSINAIQFPFMASVLSELRNEYERHQTTKRQGWTAIAISVIALVVSLWAKL